MGEAPSFRYRTLAALLLLSPAHAAEAITGRASVIDADAIEIRSQRVRLWGIDAPEGRQTCDDAGDRPYRCGQVAALALADWLGARTVSCEQRDTDRYRRTVATCSVAGQDIGAWLVRNGHALDFRRYSKGAYADDEAEARAERAGIWAGRFVPPWEWRRRK